MLQLAGIISVFDKKSSFDRIFPSQDSHSGEALGNLIALPFQSQAVEDGNSCFIDPVNLLPLENQWGFLSNISKITTERFDTIYNQLFEATLQQSDPSITIVSQEGSLEISLNNVITLSR